MDAESLRQLTTAIMALTIAIQRLEPASKATPQPKRSLTEQAVSLVLSEGITSQAELARRLGVHRSSISRLRNVRAAILYMEVVTGRTNGIQR